MIEILDQANKSNEPDRKQRRWWRVITICLVAAIFAQAVFAGAMLSGVGWGRAAHALNAVLLIAATFAAGLVAVVTLRRIPHGVKFGLMLLSLALVVVLQTAVGKSAAEGTNLMWLHVPLGVALVVFAGQAVARARKLGED